MPGLIQIFHTQGSITKAMLFREAKIERRDIPSNLIHALFLTF